jgi:hypothetical protein
MRKARAHFPFSLSNALLCEEVRQEVNGKFSLLGVFPGSLSSNTRGLLKISFFVEASAKNIGNYVLQVEVRFRDQMIVGAEAVLDVNNIKDPIVIHFPSFFVPVFESGNLVIDLIYSGARQNVITKDITVPPPLVQ